MLPLLIFRQAFLAWGIQHDSPANAQRQLLTALLPAALLLTGLLRFSGLPERLLGSWGPGLGWAGSVAALSAFVSICYLFPLTFTVRDAGRALTSDGTPRVLTGDFASTLSLETPYRAFMSRDLETMGLGKVWKNRDWRALGATHWLSVYAVDRAATKEAPAPGAVLESSYPIWPDSHGHPRLVFDRWRLPALEVAPAKRDGD